MTANSTINILHIGLHVVVKQFFFLYVVSFVDYIIEEGDRYAENFGCYNSNNNNLLTKTLMNFHLVIYTYTLFIYEIY